MGCTDLGGLRLPGLQKQKCRFCWPRLGFQSSKPPRMHSVVQRQVLVELSNSVVPACWGMAQWELFGSDTSDQALCSRSDGHTVRYTCMRAVGSSHGGRQGRPGGDKVRTPAAGLVSRARGSTRAYTIVGRRINYHVSCERD